MKRLKILAFLMVLTFILPMTYSLRVSAVTWSPFQKNSKITSSEQKMKLKITGSAKGLTLEDSKTVRQIFKCLNASNIEIYTKMKQNSNSTKVDSYSKVNLNLAGISSSYNIWTKLDMNQKKPVFKEIVNLPPLFTSFVPGIEDKDYITIDCENIPDIPDSTTPSAIDFSKLIKQTEKLNTLHLNNASFNPGFKLMNDKGVKVVYTGNRREKVHVYEVKLNDAQFKRLISYSVKYYSSNKQFMDLMKQYYENVVDESGVDSQDDINAGSIDLDKGSEVDLNDFNNFMDTIKNIKVIGDKGIVLDFTVNKSGYIVNEKGLVDIVISSKLINLMDTDSENSNTYSKAKGEYHYTLEFSNDIYNINKPVQIKYPALSTYNSIDIFKWYSNDLKSIFNVPSENLENSL